MTKKKLYRGILTLLAAGLHGSRRAAAGECADESYGGHPYL